MPESKSWEQSITIPTQNGFAAVRHPCIHRVIASEIIGYRSQSSYLQLFLYY